MEAGSREGGQGHGQVKMKGVPESDNPMMAGLPEFSKKCKREAVG